MGGNARINGGVTGATGVTLPAFVGITTQPARNTEVIEGSITGSLTVGVTWSRIGEPTFRWFSNTTDSNTGGTFTDVTVATFTIPTTLIIPTDLEEGIYYFYVEVRGTPAVDAEFVASDVAVVTVTEETESAQEFNIILIGNPAATAPPPTASTTRATEGTRVSLNAGTSETLEFVNWTTPFTTPLLPITNPTSPVASFTMPARNVTVTANWQPRSQIPVTFSVTMRNGRSGASARPTRAEAGEMITLNAGASPTGERFVGWESDDDDLEIADATNASRATFEMPARDVTVTARWLPADTGSDGCNAGFGAAALFFIALIALNLKRK
jgi:uncharacterized repeat protein (TIGR02543 family)